MPLEIRSLREEDESAIRGWLEDFVLEHRGWWEPALELQARTTVEEAAKEEWEALLRATGQDEAFVRVAADEEPLGVVQARVRPDRYLGLTVGTLAWIYVAPEARSQGVADGLMASALEWLRDQGATGLEVFVTLANERAVRLYERHGFRITDARMLGPAGSS